MDEEYFQIREALIKLLCIGDEMNIIYARNDAGIKSFSVIKKCIVMDINDRHIKVQSTPYNTFLVEIINVEAYEGKLYIWETTGLHSRKVKNMIEIIKSKGTAHV